jgi:glyoxylase-like metal-dependent hydrolase (beta-lactamase superfamily II)
MKPTRLELPTDFAVGSVNAYLFTEPEPILIDTGVKSDASWAALETELAEHGLTVADLVRVVITHPHVDHFGQAGRIAAQSKAEILVSELGRSWVVDFPSMWEKRIAFYRDSFMKPIGFSAETVDLILGYMSSMVTVCDPVPAERVTAFRLDDTLQLGGMAWQVLHTPGHASHQTCFYQPQVRQLLSADMLMAKAPTPIVERPTRGTKRVPTLPQFLESLALVESLEVDMVLPGHGRPFGDHRQVISRQRLRIQTRKSECLQLIAGGRSTLAELVDKMYPHLPPQFRFAGLWMLVGYLDLLKATGSIEEWMENGVWHYRCLE